jgi:hypothetical protein
LTFPALYTINYENDGYLLFDKTLKRANQYDNSFDNLLKQLKSNYDKAYKAITHDDQFIYIIGTRELMVLNHQNMLLISYKPEKSINLYLVEGVCTSGDQIYAFYEDKVSIFKYTSNTIEYIDTIEVKIDETYQIQVIDDIACIVGLHDS